MPDRFTQRDKFGIDMLRREYGVVGKLDMDEFDKSIISLIRLN